MMGHRLSPFFWQMLLSVLLLVGEFGAQIHGYSHLPEQMRLSQATASEGTHVDHVDNALGKLSSCDTCLALASLGAGLLRFAGNFPILGILLIVSVCYLISFTAPIRLSFRSRAPPVFS